MSPVFIGIKGHVLAVDRRSGEELWRVKLPARYRSSASFVNVVRDAEGLFASCAGELFALDPKTGQLLWNVPLQGLGTGLVSIATELGGNTQAQVLMEAERRAQEERSHAAAT